MRRDRTDQKDPLDFDQADHRHRDLELIAQLLLMATFLVAALIIGFHIYLHH